MDGPAFTLGLVSEPFETPNGDKGQLGSLLELLHRADSPFRSVEATYRIWRHEERASAAWRAGIDEERRRGASISTYGVSDKSSGPVEREEVLRIWRPDDRVRELGAGADRYRLEVDAQRGVLLEVLALRDGEPFQRITTVEVEFDHSISDERFRFQPPAGEEIRPTRGVPLERLSLREAQRRAPFTVLIPDRIPRDWHVSCLFRDPSDRPRWPGSVALIYTSDDGHESVSLSQFSAVDKSSVMLADDEWDDVPCDGRTIRATRRDARSEAQAQLEHDGTFVILTSRTLTRDELATIAGGLKPAPDTSSI